MEEQNYPSRQENEVNQNFNQNDHQEFLNKKTDSLGRTLARIAGKSMSVLGFAYAVTGILDVCTGGEVSKNLMQIGTIVSSDFISTIAKQLAAVPEIVRLTGSLPLITVGNRIYKNNKV